MLERRHCLWESPDGNVAVHLAFEVVDQINAAIVEAAGSAPVRGAEIGGLLLGKAERRGRLTVWIDSFELLPCRYARGPSFHVDPQDLPDVSAPAIVGFFRTHTRRDLFLSDDDGDFFSKHFAKPDQVFLLVKPFTTRPNLGGFFYWENGEIHRTASHREFPFHRRELGGGEPAAVPVPAVATPADVENSWPPAEHPAAKPSRAPLLWFAAAIVILAAAAPFAYYQYDQAHQRPAPRKFALPGFRLTAAEHDRDITLTWDKSALAIVTATKGVLEIDEGTFHKTVDIEPGQLRTGSVLYSRPVAISDTVAFHLRVFTNIGEPILESVQVISNLPVVQLPPGRAIARFAREPVVTLSPGAQPTAPKPVTLPLPPAITRAQTAAPLAITGAVMPKVEPPKPETAKPEVSDAEAPTVARPAPRRAPQ